MQKNRFAQKNFETSLYFRYDLGSLIQTAAEICGELTTICNLDELVEKSVCLIQQALGYDQVVLYLLDTDRQRFASKIMARVNHGQVIRSYSPESETGLAHHAVQQNRTIQIGDLATQAPAFFRPGLINIRSELHIPLEQNQKVIGVLSLGSTGRNMFDETDIVFVLKALATQIALSIDRVLQDYPDTPLPLLHSAEEKLYSHVVNVQEILPEIQLLADVSEVYNKIVQGVVEGLGYTGAMLAVLDEEKQMLAVQAIALDSFSRHQNWNMVEKLFGIKVMGNSVSLVHDQGNLGVQTCLTGEARITHDLYDLFQPVVNPKLSYRIQKSFGVKTCISMPLLVNERVVGNLYAGNIY